MLPSITLLKLWGGAAPSQGLVVPDGVGPAVRADWAERHASEGAGGKEHSNSTL